MTIFMEITTKVVADSKFCSHVDMTYNVYHKGFDVLQGICKLPKSTMFYDKEDYHYISHYEFLSSGTIEWIEEMQ